MYTYNVTIKIESVIHDEWLKWMRTIHMPEVIATGMFESCQLQQLLEPNDATEDAYTFIAQYFTSSLDNYHTYIEKFAPALREKGFAVFGNKFIAFRSLLQLV